MWRFNPVYFLVVLMVLLLGCAAQATPQVQYVTATPGATGAQPVPSLPPLAVSLEHPLPTEGEPALPEPVLPPKPCDRPADTATRYTVDAVLDWTAYQVRATQQIAYTNMTSAPQSELVFQVEPNRQGELLRVERVSFGDGRSQEQAPQSQSNRLTVGLPGGVGANCTIELTLEFTLNIPPILNGYAEGRIGYFGFVNNRQINLGHWLPVVALYQQGWYTPRNTFVGEQTMTDAAHFLVTLKLENAPPTAIVAGPGVMKLVGSQQWSFELEDARDLTLSIGNGFQRRSLLAENGTVIDLFYFPEHEPVGYAAADQALQAAAESLLLYNDLFRVPYPHPRLVVVQGEFPDGMEFSGIVFVSKDWFTSWRGQINSWLTIITVHEVAHQWWYMLVGNDPTAYPYLDEAFATYSEYLYFEALHDEHADWWWDFRIRAYNPQGLVDSDVYRYNEGRPYINAVYLRGAEMLHTVRATLGDEGFFDWLFTYAETNQGRVASPAELWGALPPEGYATLEGVRQQFLSGPASSPPQSPRP
ncbi:MAG: M1 family metallopeptidase, partial [Anaerolineae bacterium]|nr:M1 family metallopeptidase [Anaerolineae bacterium]